MPTLRRGIQRSLRVPHKLTKRKKKTGCISPFCTRYIYLYIPIYTYKYKTGAQITARQHLPPASSAAFKVQVEGDAGRHRHRPACCRFSACRSIAVALYILLLRAAVESVWSKTARNTHAFGERASTYTNSLSLSHSLSRLLLEHMPLMWTLPGWCLSRRRPPFRSRFVASGHCHRRLIYTPF